MTRYEIKSYAGSRHPRVKEGLMRLNSMVLHTWHIGEASRDIEVAAYRERMKRGEITHIEVINCDTHETETLR